MERKRNRKRANWNAFIYNGIALYYNVVEKHLQEKNRNESRIRYLERMVKSAVIIDDSSKEDEVGMNNTVTVVFEEDNSEASYKIVRTVRTNSLKGLISIESPLGKALMKHKVGDRIKVDVNENISYYVSIKEIDKSTDDSDDALRQY